MKHRQPRGWDSALTFLLIGGIIIVAVLWLGPKIMGADSIWVEIKPPQEESKGQAIRMVCDDSDTLWPLSWNGIECSVTVKHPFVCSTTDKKFKIDIKVCDWIKWGRKVAKEDIDSLVDRSDWTIKDKKKKDK